MATIDLTKRGPAGIDGTAIASGHGNPRASFGVEGWLYVNLSSTALFRKENGVWVAKFFMKGLKGDAGKRGISLRSGSGAPSDEVGNPGDAYFNVLNGDVYGPKASNGTWPASPVGSLRGPQGVQGIQGNVGAQGVQGIPGTPGTSVSPLVYAQLNKILASANDIAACFIYDTRRDSDLGWWRFKCQSLSWYNETLGTATRGMRKEFPAVVAIVLRGGATATGVLQIFDLTDLDGSGVPRLWMSFSVGGTTVSDVYGMGPTGGGSSYTSVFACQGRIFISHNNFFGLCTINFALDEISLNRDGGTTLGKFRGGIAQRNTNAGYDGVLDASKRIVNSIVNIVHARAIAGSPTDAMGLIIPHVAVATAGGASVILPNGVVWDITGQAFKSAKFTSDTELSFTEDGAVGIQYGPLPSADIAHSSWRTDRLTQVSVPAVSTDWGKLLGSNGKSIGSASRLTLIERGAAMSSSMSAHITKDYATGWMAGDTRLATLCDTATGNLVGANVYSNDGTDTSGFSSRNSGILTTSGGALVVSDGGINSAGARRTITGLTIGLAYRVSAKIRRGALATEARLDFGGVASLMIASSTSFVTFEKQIIATATSHDLDIYALGLGGSGMTAEFDDISIDVAVPDRSYKAKGLRAVGTITRTAVASGADMVAHSGFSAANYYEQPYNSDLDFGTGPALVAVWVKIASAGTQLTLICRDSATTGARLLLYLNASGAPRFLVSDGTNSANAAAANGIADGQWHLLVGIDDGTTAKLLVDGVLVASAASTAVGSLSNAAAILRLGLDAQGANPATGVSLAMARLSAYAATDAQIAQMFRDEKPMTNAGAKCVLGGSSNDVKALDYDPDRNVLAVGTADGVSEFSGLVRFGYFDTTNCALTNDSMKCVSRRDGFRLYGGGADIIANRDLSFTADDAAMRASYLRTLIPDTSLLATSAALAALSATVAGITVPVKGAGTDYWTGTDDAKFMTAKALRDAGALVPIASAATINLNGNSGLVFDLVLDHNASFALPTNLKNGETYTIIITQGTTGGTGAFNGAYDFRGVTPTLSVGAGKIDIVSGVYKASSGKLISSFSKAV